MRYLLAFFFSVFIKGMGFAQSMPAYHPFPEGEAIWTLLDWNSATVYYGSYMIQSGDTIINGYTYHKLYHEPNNNDYPFADTGYVGCTRQNINQKYVYIFLRNDSIERLLYDFSDDDTINAPFPNTIQKPDTSSTLDNIFKLRYGYTGHDSTICYGYTDSENVYWGGIFYPDLFEGIGAIQGGLITRAGEFSAPGTNGYLVTEWIMCLYSGDTLLFNRFDQYDSTGGGCVSLLTAGITALPDGSHLRVNPNPVSNYIAITYNDLPAEHKYYFTVYNLLGQPILIQPLAPAGTTLPCANWQNGIYIWQVKDETGNKLTEGKLVKE